MNRATNLDTNKEKLSTLEPHLMIPVLRFYENLFKILLALVFRSAACKKKCQMGLLNRLV
jgi:long-subunit acyl-CoA synthetase (AMP-forming)